MPEKLFGHQAAEAEPLTSLVPGLSPGLAAVVEKTMRKSPDDRYATPLALALALESYSDDAPAGLAGSEASRVGVPEMPGLGDSGTRGDGATTAITTSRSTTSGADLRPSDSGAIPFDSTAPTASASASHNISSATGAEPPPAPTMPVSDAVGLDFQVDLGPEMSLTESLTSTRVKAKPKSKVVKSRPRPRVVVDVRLLRGRHLLVAAIVAAILMLAAGGVILAVIGNIKGRGSSSKAVATGDKTGSGKVAAAPVLPSVKGKEVAVVAADGTVTVERRLPHRGPGGDRLEGPRTSSQFQALEDHHGGSGE